MRQYFVDLVISLAHLRYVILSYSFSYFLSYIASLALCPIKQVTTNVRKLIPNFWQNNALPWQAIASFKPQGQTGWDRENKFIHLPESLFRRPQRRIHEAGSNKLSKTTNSSQKNGGTTFHKCTQDNAKEESTRPRLSWMAVCEKNCDEKYSTMVQDIKNLDLKNMLLIELPRTASRDTKPVTHRKTISIPLVPFESDATNDVEEGDKSLPQGWRELTSHTTGHTYYGNIYTGESVWKRPTTCAIADSSPRKSQQLRTMTGLLSDQPLSRRTVRTDVKKGSEEPVPHNSIKHLPRNKGICGQIEQWKPEAARAKPGVTPEILPADQHNPNVVGVSEAPLAHRVDLSRLPPTQTTDQPSVRFGFMPKASMMCFSCFTLPVRRHVTRKHSDETRSISAEHSKGNFAVLVPHFACSAGACNLRCSLSACFLQSMQSVEHASSCGRCMFCIFMAGCLRTNKTKCIFAVSSDLQLSYRTTGQGRRAALFR